MTLCIGRLARLDLKLVYDDKKLIYYCKKLDFFFISKKLDDPLMYYNFFFSVCYKLKYGYMIATRMFKKKM